MLDGLRSWAMVLSGVAVFGSLCEVILPEGSFQKYIRLGLGMMLVLALLSPLQKLIRQDWDGESFDTGYHAYLEREAMEEAQQTEVIRIYKANLNRKMLASLTGRLPGFSGKVRCKVEEENPESFGRIQEVLVLPETEEEPEEIKRILKEDFGVPEDGVTIRYLKEKNG